MVNDKIAVAMSGGIDSSIAAFLLKQERYDVFGIHLKLQRESSGLTRLKNIGHKLDIPLHELDVSKQFHESVVRYFCDEYASGRTPNPCIICNSQIKFGLLFKEALKMGAKYFATGHYARILRSTDGYYLCKGIDSIKDQSYFLYTLGQKQLQRLSLPLGSYYKDAVRKLARELQLSPLIRNESQDICFIPNNDYRSFITQYITLKTGMITDTKGKVIGKHNGLSLFTVGQRRGLGISVNEPYYVIDLDPSQNRIVVGPYETLLKKKVLVRRLNWVSGKTPKNPTKATAKIRYRSPEAIVSLHPNNTSLIANFDQPQWAITPGQSIVFYDGDIILGGGIIDASEN